MADGAVVTAPTATPTSPTPTSRRGRGHGRRNSDPRQGIDSPRSRAGRGHRGGKGRGRSQMQGANGQTPTDANITVPLERPPGGGFGARLTGAASQNEDEIHSHAAQTQRPRKESVTDDGEVCFICANPIDHVSIAPCNHQTCHICSLRLRALYKTRACAHCRTEAPFVVFTDNANKRFQDFTDDEFVKIDQNLGVKYEKNEILEDTILLLRYNCPDKDCDVACLGWPDLHRHVKSKHGKVMCDLCTRNKKVFTHEHELFSFGELRKHERYGDDNPGAVDQSGFKGHPECGFCRQRFYGDDELYTHCREKHERCHICDRQNGGRNPQYYLNYQELEKHFADLHFVCLDAECQANKTNVFESEMDLKAHQLSEHPNGLSKDARREARLVNLSGFDVRTPYEPQRNNRREGRGRGRGRDPNAEPLPISSAQPMSRAEQAFQRTLAIQSAQSVTNRTFGGSLTQTTTAPTPRASAVPASPQPQQTNPVPELENLGVNIASLSPQEQARHLRHQAVTERATSLLKNDQTKLSQFRTYISAFRSGTTSASALIDSFFSLFDCQSSELGKLIRELADLYEDETKRKALLEAWNNWKSINEDYPSLPGPAGMLPGSNSALGVNVGSGRRVLKLKSSTAQSRQASGSWGNSLHSGASRDPFPALASVAGSTSKQGQSGGRVWGGSSTAPVSARPSFTPSAATKTNTSSARLPPTMSARQNEEMFPSLPKAEKPNTLIRGINTRGTPKWGSGSNTPVNAWGAGGRTPTPGEAMAAINAAASQQETGEAVAETEGLASKKKGKGKKKGEMLFHFG